MSGGLLQGMYSGTRGLDLGPTKMRTDEAFRRKQLMEDMRRALAGAKLQASELALRQGSMDQQRDIEMKRQALEEKLSGNRMAFDREKLTADQDAMLGYIGGRPTVEQQKLTAGLQMAGDLSPWERRAKIAQVNAQLKANKAGYMLDPDTGAIIYDPAPPAKPEPLERKGDYKDIPVVPEKTPAEKINEGTQKQGGSTEPVIPQTEKQAAEAHKKNVQMWAKAMENYSVRELEAQREAAESFGVVDPALIEAIEWLLAKARAGASPSKSKRDTQR